MKYPCLINFNMKAFRPSGIYQGYVSANEIKRSGEKIHDEIL